jgi:hypothetical protein
MFAIVAVLLLTASVLLLVQGGLQASALLNTTGFSFEFWRSEFWVVPDALARSRIGPNVGWFLRGVGGLVTAAAGWWILRRTR